jgi:hypothetical protein
MLDALAQGRPQLYAALERRRCRAMHRKPKLHRPQWRLTGWGGGKIGKPAYSVEICTYPGCGKTRRKNL